MSQSKRVSIFIKKIGKKWFLMTSREQMAVILILAIFVIGYLFRILTID